MSVNLALHLVCSFSSSSVSEWSVCEVCLHSPVMFTQQQGKGGANWVVYSVIHGLTDKRSTHSTNLCTIMGKIKTKGHKFVTLISKRHEFVILTIN